MGGLEQGKDAAHVQLRHYLRMVFRDALTYWTGSEIGLKSLVNETGQQWLKQAGVIQRQPGSTAMELKPSFRENLAEKMVEQVLSEPVELKFKGGEPSMMNLLLAASNIKSLMELERSQQESDPSPIKRIYCSLVFQDGKLYFEPEAVVYASGGSTTDWSEKDRERYRCDLG